MHTTYLFSPTCTECGPGKHGVNCIDDCSPYCSDSNTCGHKDGVCDCIDWVVGNTCDLVIGK